MSLNGSGPGASGARLPTICRSSGSGPPVLRSRARARIDLGSIPHQLARRRGGWLPLHCDRRVSRPGRVVRTIWVRAHRGCGRRRTAEDVSRPTDCPGSPQTAGAVRRLPRGGTKVRRRRAGASVATGKGSAVAGMSQTSPGLKGRFRFHRDVCASHRLGESASWPAASLARRLGRTVYLWADFLWNSLNFFRFERFRGANAPS